jgi:hypothetical protein
MPHLRIAAVAILSLFTLIACKSTPAPPRAAAPLTSTPDAVRGTLRLRHGATFPPGATLHIVARCYGRMRGAQSFKPDGHWPLTFAVPLEWPQGKDDIFLESLGVYATAELNGRVLMVTDEKFADPPNDPTLISYENRRHGAPVDLVLVPTVE